MGGAGHGERRVLVPGKGVCFYKGQESTKHCALQGLQEVVPNENCLAVASLYYEQPH